MRLIRKIMLLDIIFYEYIENDLVYNFTREGTHVSTYKKVKGGYLQYSNTYYPIHNLSNEEIAYANLMFNLGIKK